MEYSPKLKVAMKEIKAVLDKHDIAGVVILHTPGNSEYLSKFDPSYSCMKVEDGKVRIRAKLEDFKDKPDPELARNTILRDTSNMIKLLTETTINIVYPYFAISEELDKRLGAEHSEGGHTDETTQNN